MKQLRVRIRKQSGGIISRPSKIIHQEIQIQKENLLKTNDLRNLAQSLYRERRKDLPKLFKYREDVNDSLDILDLNTNKDERFLARNSRETGIVIFTCVTMLNVALNSSSNYIPYMDVKMRIMFHWCFCFMVSLSG